MLLFTSVVFQTEADLGSSFGVDDGSVHDLLVILSEGAQDISGVVNGDENDIITFLDWGLFLDGNDGGWGS